MGRLIALRLVHGAAIVFVVATLTFVLIHLAPGDPLGALGESPLASREFREQERRNWGLDRPLPEQYLRYLGRLVRGDWGTSFAELRPVRDVLLDRVPNTLLLATTALLVDFALGIALGALQGARPGSRLDETLSVVTLTLYSVPVFWLGLMLLLLFGQHLEWFPVGGARDPVLYHQLPVGGQILDRLHHLALPALTLGLAGAAATARYQRAAMLEAVRQDFVRAARARGLTERAVLLRHALRNALLPVITLFGISLPILLSGAVLVETVFAWPGMGKLAVDAILRRDIPVVTGAAILAAAMVALGSLVADILYWIADPRTREEPA